MTLSSGSRVASVDGLRGLLAALVTVEHFPYLHAQTIFAVPSRLAVMIFFAMSGYVLTRAWDGDLPIFLVRRFVRLWPLYALCLFVGGAAIHHAPPWTYYVWWRVPDDAGYIHGDPAAWSLFIEAWAMPLMPLVVWAGTGPTIRLILAMAALTLAGLAEPRLLFGVLFLGGAFVAGIEWRNRLLESALPQWLGKVSYSLYLSHCLVLALASRAFGPWGGVAAIPAMLVVAWIVWRVLEAPCVRLSQRIGRGPRPAPEAGRQAAVA